MTNNTTTNSTNTNHDKSPLDKLFQLQTKYMKGGSDASIQKQHDKGKLTARERLLLLFDENTFVELDMFVRTRSTNFDIHKNLPHSESVVTGYGLIHGRLVYAYSQDFTIVGGSLGEMHAKKITKVMDNAHKMGAPLVGINDSGGARIQEGIDALNGYGEIFYRNTKSSGVIPQITAIMGPCAGGAVYSPALTDFIFMVENSSQMFITGPQVIKSVTGEDVSAETLGGASTHNGRSGVAHFSAPNDETCIAQIKQLISYLPSNYGETPPTFQPNDDPNRSVDLLNSVIPQDANTPYNVLDIINTVMDNGSFLEIQAQFAQNIIIGFARLNGSTIGIVANQPQILAGCLDIDASDKAARFVRFCDAFNIPILTIVDVPGFLPGTNQEFNGIIRHGAKLLYAYSEATTPKVQLVTRKAYGGSYLAMSPKSLGGDICLAWPTAEIAVMGASGAANIIFRKEIAKATDKEATKTNLINNYESEFNTPYKAAERGLIDDVIEPATTRIRLIDAFNMLHTKNEVAIDKKHGNIPL